jgi:hypothetical protein
MLVCHLSAKTNFHDHFWAGFTSKLSNWDINKCKITIISHNPNFNTICSIQRYKNIFRARLHKINVACFPVSYSCTSLKCYMVYVWKAIRIKSWEIYISYIKRNICSSLKSNEQINVFVLISMYRSNLYVTIEEVTWRSLHNLRNDFYFI